MARRSCSPPTLVVSPRRGGRTCYPAVAAWGRARPWRALGALPSPVAVAATSRTVRETTRSLGPASERSRDGGKGKVSTPSTPGTTPGGTWLWVREWSLDDTRSTTRSDLFPRPGPPPLGTPVFHVRRTHLLCPSVRVNGFGALLILVCPNLELNYRKRLTKTPDSRQKSGDFTSTILWGVGGGGSVSTTLLIQYLHFPNRVSDRVTTLGVITIDKSRKRGPVRVLIFRRGPVSGSHGGLGGRPTSPTPPRLSARTGTYCDLGLSSTLSPCVGA